MIVLLLNQILVPFSQLRFSILAGARRGATGLSRKVLRKVTRAVVGGRLIKRQRGVSLNKNVIFAPNATLREACFFQATPFRRLCGFLSN